MDGWAGIEWYLGGWGKAQLTVLKKLVVFLGGWEGSTLFPTLFSLYSTVGEAKRPGG